jgi:ABC-type transporter Mla MlaB component
MNSPVSCRRNGHAGCARVIFLRPPYTYLAPFRSPRAAGDILNSPMVFSFFKKKGSGPEVPRAPKRHPRPEPASPEFDVDPHRTLAGIEVSDAGSGLSRAAEEAAILYAHGSTDAAIDLLLQDVGGTGGPRSNPLAWFMLFDLYQLQGMRQEFEKLALNFVVEFERSAPVWTEIQAVEPRPAGRSGAGANRATVAMSGVLSQSGIRWIAELEAAAARVGGVRLDFGRLRGVDESGCVLLLDALDRVRASGRELDIVGGRALQKLLRNEIESRGKSCPENWWQLLLRLYQFEGMQQEFENLSLDFAVAHEVSPPPWEPLGMSKAAQPIAEYAAPGVESEREALPLAGVIIGANPSQVSDIVSYAASHAVVHIDMTRVRRVDFVAAGALLNAFMSLSHLGKGIMIHGANELIQALFRIVGLNQYAVVARNKQH